MDSRFSEDYFERGKSLGISWYEDYRWMHKRSQEEALAFLVAMGSGACRIWPSPIFPMPGPTVTDYGCAKGFFVRAMLPFVREVRGIDLSEYALSCGTIGTFGKLHSVESALNLPPTDLGFCKDVLEHCEDAEALGKTLRLMARLAQRWLVIVPFGENGKYRIPEYESDKTHMIRGDEAFWWKLFEANDLQVDDMRWSVPGIKEKWVEKHAEGNGFFFLTSIARCGDGCSL